MTETKAVAIIVTHRTQPGRRDDTIAVWMAHMPAAVAANAGHLAYFYTTDLAEPDVIRAFQLYSSADEARAFLTTPAYLAYVAAVEPYLAGPPEVSQSALAWRK